MKLLIVLACLLASLGCGSKSSSCVEGASTACACANGATGAQRCNAKGTFDPCVCGAGSAEKPTSCSLDALKCEQFSDGGLEGWKLHKLVYDARVGKDFAKTVCLASISIKSPDTVLQGASHYEASFGWAALGCLDLAKAEIESSLTARPQGRSGWKETCDQCKKLGANCAACDGSTAPTASTAKCPSDADAAALVKRAVTTYHPITIVSCAPGKFPDVGTAFIAWEGAPSGDTKRPYNQHHLVVREGGAFVASMKREGNWHERMEEMPTEVKKLLAVDLDGDGTDELVEETELMRRGWIIGSVTVYAIRGTTLEAIGTVQSSYSDGAMKDDPKEATECSATWKVDGRTLVFTSMKASGSEAKSCIRGTQRYAIRGGKLTQ